MATIVSRICDITGLYVPHGKRGWPPSKSWLSAPSPIFLSSAAAERRAGPSAGRAVAAWGSWPGRDNRVGQRHVNGENYNLPERAGAGTFAAYFGFAAQTEM